MTGSQDRQSAPKSSAAPAHSGAGLPKRGINPENSGSHALGNADKIAKQLDELAEQEGFFTVGVTQAAPIDDSGYFQRWLEQGRHGEMSWLAADPEQRLDPSRLLPGVRSIVCLGDRHAIEPEGEEPGMQAAQAGAGAGAGGGAGGRGRVARYAWGRDYHRSIRKRLHRISDQLAAAFPGERFRSTVDTAPLMERIHAKRAGLGFIGKHTLLIHPALGSWFLLGCILTTADLCGGRSLSALGAKPEAAQEAEVGCGTCTRCIDACPTRCIDGQGYTLDASACISYLTLEHRGRIDPGFFEAMGDWLAGCDVCQEVCPFNRSDRPITMAMRGRHPPGPDSRPRRWAGSLNLLEVLAWEEQDRQEQLAGSALMRMKLPMIKRNALINALHHLRAEENSELRGMVERLAGGEQTDPLVRQTAVDVLAALAEDRVRG